MGRTLHFRAAAQTALGTCVARRLALTLLLCCTISSNGNIQRATSSATRPDGLFCGEKSISMLLLNHNVRISVHFDASSDTMGFKVTGDTEVPSCKGMHFIVRALQRLWINETASRPPCLLSLERKYEIRYTGDTIIGKHPLLGKFSVLPKVVWRPQTDVLDIEITGVPMLKKVDVQLSKAKCRKRRSSNDRSEL